MGNRRKDGRDLLLWALGLLSGLAAAAAKK